MAGRASNGGNQNGPESEEIRVNQTKSDLANGGMGEGRSRTRRRQGYGGQGAGVLPFEFCRRYAAYMGGDRFPTAGAMGYSVIAASSYVPQGGTTEDRPAAWGNTLKRGLQQGHVEA
jgi:hypothetical protein